MSTERCLPQASKSPAAPSTSPTTNTITGRSSCSGACRCSMTTRRTRSPRACSPRSARRTLKRFACSPRGGCTSTGGVCGSGDSRCVRCRSCAIVSGKEASMEQTNGHTVHCAQLPEAKPGEALSLEWNTYRREVQQLLAAGHEGKFVLIKDQAIIGLYATENEAVKAGYQRYLRQP